VSITSALFYIVVPQRSTVEDPVHKLGDVNVPIDCPLRFGSLRQDWSIQWIAKDRNDIMINSSEYLTRMEPKYQLFIKKASTKYDRAKFQCRAIRPHYTKDSQFVTLVLFRKWLAE